MTVVTNKKYTSQQADIETSSENYLKRFEGEAGRYFLDTQKKIVLALLNNYKGASVLDAGGGHAQIAVPLVENGYRVTIAASSPQCRKLPDLQLKQDEYNFSVCDLLDLPFEDGSFDIVLSFRLLTHEPNWSYQIDELCRVARLAVVVDYPDKRSFNTFYTLLFSLKKKIEVNTRPFMTFNRSQIAKQFAKNGFATFISKPEFFLPMVVHRIINNSRISSAIEKMCKWLGLHFMFGSPVILMAIKSHE